ncbi:MAG TPA: FMN-binding protein [Ktedonobacteraceae bacterium]
MINNYADPQLTSEAIQAQSANVDIVSGATDSSEAFIQSLNSALAQAKA